MSTKTIRPAKPDYSNEQAILDKQSGPIAGIDEAGRGPWAGPVVACAVILDPKAIPDGLNDSKKLKPARREALFETLKHCAEIGTGIADVETIDRDNILNATLWAMSEAIRQLPSKPGFVLVDGKQLPQCECQALALIGGDGLSLSIAAASICAKVTRDTIMRDLAGQHPGYGWERNMGYGTAEHSQALQHLGITSHHRRSYKPIAKLIGA